MRLTEEEGIEAGKRELFGSPAEREAQRGFNRATKMEFRDEGVEEEMLEEGVPLTFAQMAKLMATTVSTAVKESREEPGLLDDSSTKISGAQGAASILEAHKSQLTE